MGTATDTQVKTRYQLNNIIVSPPTITFHTLYPLTREVKSYATHNWLINKNVPDN